MAMPDPGNDEGLKPVTPTDDDDQGGVDIDLSTLPENAQKKIQSLSAQRATHKEKRQKAEQLAEERGTRVTELEAELARLKTPPPESSPKPPVAPKPTDASSDAQWRERVDFLVRHRDFSAEELDELSAVAKGKGVSLEDALKTPVWGAYASARKLEAEKAAASLKGSPSSDKMSKDLELNEEQKAVAKKMGVSEESYKKTLLKRAASASQ